MAALRIKRGTRAQLDAAATAGQLAVGEPYLITDEGRLAVGTSLDAYQAAAKQGELPRITISASAPANPAVGDIWVDISA